MIWTDLQTALGREGYVASDDLAVALQLALSLGRPLLLEGAAGVGKTEVARTLASVQDTQLIRLQCYEGLDAAQAIYEWNYQRQLLTIRAAAEDGETGKQVEDRIFSRDFLLERPLLAAITQDTPPVLLIDEIDRADEEFEAYLLEILSDYQVSIPELGTITATTKPIVILTSNGTRDLSDALRRRCLYTYVDYPDRETETAILQARCPQVEARLGAQIVGFVQKLREEELEKTPGIAEMLDFAAALMGLGIADLTDDPAVLQHTLTTLLKTQSDQAQITTEVAMRIAGARGMTRVTRFAGRDPGPAARVAGFIAHLRSNGLRLGVAEADLAMCALGQVNAISPDEARRALRAVCTGCKDEAERFDGLFDSFWMDAGRVKQKIVPSNSSPASDDVHSSRDADGQDASGAGSSTAPDDDQGDADSDGTGKLIATEVRNLSRKDLRDLVRPEEVAEAEAVARRIGAALRDKRSRRRVAARKGDRLHFRKIMRHSLSTGGEPIRLLRKRRPDRTRKIVALCDVSGSMTVYAQVFLAFLAGLMRADMAADAYLFHTRLVRITEALRDKDAMRAIGRMSLMADGFGGGSKIGPSLQLFADTYAKRFVDGRSVVLILSDGYDTAPPAHISDALTKLKKRGCKIIWLNPLKGWRDYAPVAEGMAAALAHLDLFKPANTLADLAALEAEVTAL